MCFLSSSHLFSQDPPPYQRDFTPQSPAASAFNKYGDIGVSYFTGSPNISFPISVSEEVPISISYNASGNKPEEHHGWVGSGFNLNVGGMVSRIKRGQLDEYKANTDDQSGIKSYLENSSLLQGTSSTWDGDALLTVKVEPTSSTKATFLTDLEPDEFVFNCNGISGSFMLNHEGKWVIRGNNPSKLQVKEVNLQTNQTIRLDKSPGIAAIDVDIPRVIMGFTIRTNDGTEYYFGGDQSSTDFTYNINSNPSTTRYTTLSAMGWHLTKIKTVSGKEINFLYQKDGFSMLLNTTNSAGYTSLSWNPSFQGISSSYTSFNGGGLLKYAYTILNNSYLSEIQTPYETTIFKRSLITAAEADQYPYKNDAEQVALTNGFDWNNSRWFKLNEIKTYTKNTQIVSKHVVFEYIKSPSNRLQLKKIRQIDVDKIDYTAATTPVYDVTNSIPIVDFVYNTSTLLPAYGTGLIDHWGYYTDKGGISYTGQSGYYARREPSAATMKAEILTTINYPTGGYTTFEFEPHDYHSYITKYLPVTYTGNTPIVPVETANQYVNEMASGLRISKIISSPDGINTLEKTYRYVRNYTSTSDFIASSGILASKPIYFDEFTGSIQYPILPPANSTGTLTFNEYYFMTEQSLNLLNLTNGSPVTYSEVTEINKDNSYTIYKFSNYNNEVYCNRKALKTKTLNNTRVVSPSSDPIIDYEALRGKLIEQKACNASNQPVQKTVNEYTTTLDNTSAIRAIHSQWVLLKHNAQELRASSYLIYTSPVFLNKTTTTDYYYDAGTQASSEMTIISENSYDGYQNIIQQTVKHINDAEIKSNITTNYSYAYNPANFTQINPSVTEPSGVGTLAVMLSKFMIGIPLETKNTFKKGSKVEFKRFNNGTVTDAVLPYIMYNQNQTGTAFIEQFRINGYTEYDKPTSTTQKGFLIPVNYEDWTNGLLRKKSFGTGNLKLTSIYDYDLSKRLISNKTNENGVRQKYTFDGLQRLNKAEDRFAGTFATPTDVQATTNAIYQYKNAQNPFSFIQSNATYKDVAMAQTTKQFMDGLGRPVMTQRTNNDGTFTKSYVTYDILGRQDRSYEPIVNGTEGVDANYLNFTTGVLKNKAFTYVQYETSPLSRPLKQYNLDGTFITMAYGCNTATEVSKFSVTSSPNPINDDVILPDGFYGVNSLSKTTITNENGKITQIFKDKLGRVVLTRKYLNGQNVDTYNVYDNCGQLVMVIPPDALTTSNYPIASLVFCYKYDIQNRLARKKVPSADWQKFYYDNRDLLTLTQDGNMRAQNSGRYLATQYDELGRVMRTGWVDAGENPATLAESSLMIADADALTKTEYYPNKSWVKHQAAKVLKSAGVSTLRDWIWNYTEYRAGLSENTGYPAWSARQHLMNLTNNADNTQITDNDVEGVDWQVSSFNGAGKPTATVRYLFSTGGNTPVRTLQNYTYDPILRLTQEDYSYGLSGAGFGNTVTLSNLVYNNNRDQLIEKNIGKGTSGKYLQSIDYSYNTRGWLTAINSVNVGRDNIAVTPGGVTPLMKIMTPTSTGEGTIINMAVSPYVQQALLTSPPPVIADDNPDLYSQIINYENADSRYSGTPQYNGNISSTAWQIAGRAAQAFGYTYDDLDRLTEAKYYDITTSLGPKNSTKYTFSTDNKFREALTYDKRGNILSLQRNGLNAGTWASDGSGYTVATYGMIDNLTYTYSDSNRLSKVTDASLALKGFKYNNSGNPRDCYYDANGNLKIDLNKRISNIEYNYLNLPQKITFTQNDGVTVKGYIMFVYDANGAKLRKIVQEIHQGLVANTTTYEYINGVEYEGTNLQRIQNTEGSIVRNEFGQYDYEYVLRDHLGNTRVTFKDGTNKGAVYYDWNTYTYIDPNQGNTGYNDGVVGVSDIKQINNYYPFGLNMEGNWNGAAGANKYQYNGKQLNSDFGLEWNDYGARFYDAAVGRFPTVDRFAEKYVVMSPYQYAANNPIKFVDMNGDSIDVSTIYYNDNKTLSNINNDLRQQTGLNISSTATGEKDLLGRDKYSFTYEKDKDGNAVVAKDADGNSLGSATARDLLVNCISSCDKVEVGVSKKGSKAGGNVLLIDSKQIQSFIDGTSKDINNKTLGFGMTFMHEIQHTNLGGAHVDDVSGIGKTGAVVDKMNIIRSQLGNDFGQRTSYMSVFISGAGTFIPFSSKALNVMQGGIAPILTGGYISY